MREKTKVLVIEEDIGSLTRLYLGLSQAGFNVEVSDNMNEILQRVNRFKPQVILVNYALTVNKENFTSIINNKASIIILYLTDIDQPQEENIQMIKKTFKLNEVVEKIKKLTRRKK